MDEWKRKRNKDYLIKLDIEKAFDSQSEHDSVVIDMYYQIVKKAFDKVDWSFLDNILKGKGFGSIWWIWIWGCVSIANFSILIKGRPQGKILGTRGFRQGIYQ